MWNHSRPFRLSWWVSSFTHVKKEINTNGNAEWGAYLGLTFSQRFDYRMIEGNGMKDLGRRTKWGNTWNPSLRSLQAGRENFVDGNISLVFTRLEKIDSSSQLHSDCALPRDSFKWNIHTALNPSKLPWCSKGPSRQTQAFIRICTNRFLKYKQYIAM